MLNVKKPLFKNNQYEKISLLFIILAFPIYYLWKSWLGFGVWTLNKNFSYIPGIAFIGGLAFGYIQSWVKNYNLKKRVPELFFFAFIIWALCALMIERLNHPPLVDKLGRNTFWFNLKIILFYIAHFLIGFFFPQISKFKKAIITFWSLMLVNTLYFADYSSLVLDRSKQVLSQYLGEYPHWGDSVAIFSLWLIILVQSPKTKFFVLLFSTIALYIIESRTSFFLFLALVPVTLFLSKNYKLLKIIGFSTILIFFILKSSTLTTTRIGLALSPSMDKSTLKRVETITEGLVTIFDSPKNIIFGDLNGQVKKHNDIGHYIHSYLSLWRQFGLFPFMLFLSIGIFICYYGVIYLKNNEHPNDIHNVNLNIILTTCLYFFIQALFSRGYVSPYPWICYGIFCKMSRRNLK